MNNRMWNCKNPYQGERKKVLCICSAGLLRSPTAAVILSCEPYKFNTRSAGIDRGHALIPVDNVLLTWADEIVVMSREQQDLVVYLMEELEIDTKPIHNFSIRDSFGYMEDELVAQIEESARQCFYIGG